ncbi:MAG: hypothetical protein N2442_07220 [Spirochaetes bacterium]|nr:hypothetical protein [Spirochaetota bacterium]
MPRSRYLVLILPLLICLIRSLTGAEKESFHQRFLLHRNGLQACGFRLEGSKEEEKAFSYLRETLRNHNLIVEELDFSAMRDGHSFSKILSVSLSGHSPNALVLAIPMSQEKSPTSRMETDSDGIALVLALMEEWAQTPPPTSMNILFLGGDTGLGEGIGSKFFLQTFQSKNPALVLYLHLPKIPAILEMQTGTKGLLSPALPLELFLKSFDSKRMKLSLSGNRNQLYRMGVPVSPTPLGPFLRAQVPALGITGNPYGTSQPPALPEWLQGFQDGFHFFLSQYGALDLASSPLEWDSHYLSFHWGQQFLLLAEPTMVGILLGVLTISFILAFVRRKQTLRYLYTLLRNLWNLPFFFFLLFLFLSVGTWLLRWIEQVRFPIWEYTPLLHFLLKLSSATFLFSLFFHTLHRLPLAKRGSFYSASSILFFFVNIIVFSLINIALCYYFLWGFLCSLGFSFFKRKRTKLLFLVLAPSLLYGFTYDLFMTPELPMVRVLLFSNTGNILLAFMLLPFLLMFIRIDYLLRHPSSHKPGWGVKSIILLSGTMTLGLSGYLLSFFPFHNRPIPIYWKETLDAETETHSLVLSSLHNLREGIYTYGSSRLEIPPQSKQVEILLPLEKDPLQIQVLTTTFLNRTTYRFMITSTLPPSRIDCAIEASNTLVIYGSNFPITHDVETRWTKVFFGKNPPQPLSLTLTLPKNQPFTMNFTVYAEPQEIPFFGEGYQVVNPEYTIRKRIRIE